MLSKLLIILFLFICCCSCDNLPVESNEPECVYWMDMKNRWMVIYINGKPYYKLYDGITKQYFFRPVPNCRHKYIIKRYIIRYTFNHDAQKPRKIDTYTPSRKYGPVLPPKRKRRKYIVTVFKRKK